MHKFTNLQTNNFNLENGSNLLILEVNLTKTISQKSI